MVIKLAEKVEIKQYKSIYPRDPGAEYRYGFFVRMQSCKVV